MRVRAFAPQSQIAQVHAGDEANVLIDGLAQPVVGRVSFISPQAEYTPPVIYSRENRAKLVFMFELSFDAAVAAQLHPGQPVDVQWIAQK
jgi:HlyD family secretion protein